MSTEMTGIVVFIIGNVVLCAACWILNRILSAITDRMLK